VRGGLKDGFVKTSPYGSMVPEARARTPTRSRRQDDRRQFDIFKGELKDNTGKVVIPKGKVFKQTDIELEGMNYLIEGVIGKADPPLTDAGPSAPSWREGSCPCR
jgi:basic membrane protein A